MLHSLLLLIFSASLIIFGNVSLKKKQTKNGCSLDSKLHGGTDYLAYGWHDELFAKCGRNSVLFNALSTVRMAALSVILPHMLVPVCCYSLEPTNSSK